jgi:hypothetical protein
MSVTRGFSRGIIGAVLIMTGTFSFFFRKTSSSSSIFAASHKRLENDFPLKHDHH